MKKTLIACAAILCAASTPALAKTCGLGDAKPGAECDVIETSGVIKAGAIPSDAQVTVSQGMGMCEYQNALYSTGAFVTMPVQIRGVTDQDGSSRCFEGRWLPSSILNLSGDARR